VAGGNAEKIALTLLEMDYKRKNGIEGKPFKKIING